MQLWRNIGANCKSGISVACKRTYQNDSWDPDGIKTLNLLVGSNDFYIQEEKTCLSNASKEISKYICDVSTIGD